MSDVENPFCLDEHGEIVFRSPDKGTAKNLKSLVDMANWAYHHGFREGVEIGGLAAIANCVQAHVLSKPVPVDPKVLREIFGKRSLGGWTHAFVEFHQDGCSDCPFSSVSDRNGDDAPNPSDPDEGYYDCELTGLVGIWGENPKCDSFDWRGRALAELKSLGIDLEAKNDDEE